MRAAFYWCIVERIEGYWAENGGSEARAPDAAEFRERVDTLAQGGPAKFNLLRLSPMHVEEIVKAAPRDAADERRSVLVDAAFDGSVFEDGARFSRVRFTGDASFSGAKFENGSEASFNGVTFNGDARFDAAKFSGPAHFGGADFERGCWFSGVIFDGNANFNGGRVGESTVFDGAQFGGATLFMRREFLGHASFEFEATFSSIVRFDEAKWRGGVSFSGTRFGGETRFFGAEFYRNCSFENAIFGRDCNFAASRFECIRLLLDDVAFPDRLAIVGSADWLSCRRTRFLNGANFRLDGATADLTEAEFARPSALSGRDFRVFSMRRAYVRDLTLAGADLAQCVFVGAQSLDEVSLGDATFAASPTGWRWSRRDVILEESLWRAYIQGRHEWQAATESTDVAGRFAPDRRVGERGSEEPASDAGEDTSVASDKNKVVARLLRGESLGALAEETNQPAERLASWLKEFKDALPDAQQIGVVYRELRKAKEDSKDEPGAAGFYYGEMEMRRHSARPDTRGLTSALGFWAERGVVWTYWLVSGYALRASRALIALLVTIVVCGGLLYWFGYSPRSSFSQALLLSAETSSSLLRPLQTPHYTLTSSGQVVDIFLRLIGPLLLGLLLLSLRGRVKR